MSEFVCPVTRQPLCLVHAAGEFLEAPDGRRYPIVDEIPELLAPESRQLAFGQAACGPAVDQDIARSGEIHRARHIEQR